MNWSEHIPLVTLITVVFFGGVLWAQHAGLRGEIKKLIDKTIPRIHDRLDEDRRWRDRLDGALNERRRVRTAAHGIPVQEDETSP
jgi:hypothetical protein